MTTIPRPTAGTRPDTWVIRVKTVTGHELGYFDKKTGGAIDSEEYKYSPGGMIDPISLGGRKTVDNLVLQRIYDRVRDHDDVQRWFNYVGKEKLQVHVRPMTPGGVGYGKSIIYEGTLKRVSLPDIDSETSGSAALMEIEITIDGYPHAGG